MEEKECLQILVVLEEGAKQPEQGSEDASGYDLFISEAAVIAPGETVLIPTGIKVAVPKGYEMQVRPRSGLSLKTKIRISNSPGTVDADYRGKIGVIVDNIGRDIVHLPAGMKLAQAVFTKVEKVYFVPVQQLPATVRGKHGFGSTGD